MAALPWRPLLGLAWLFAVAGFAVRTVRAFRRQRLVVACSCRQDPGEVPDLVRFPIGRSGLGRMLAAGEGLPEIRTSTEITSPQLVWVGRPVVLVPRTLVDRGGDALAWAVCHELVHLRRRDHWSGLVVHVAERLFFFHPLARVAAREFLVCREIACDAEVVRSMDAPPRDYGRLLVALGFHGGRSRLAVAGAASSLHALKRRLIMLQHVPSSAPSRRWRLGIATDSCRASKE